MSDQEKGLIWLVSPPTSWKPVLLAVLRATLVGQRESTWINALIKTEDYRDLQQIVDNVVVM